MKRPLILTAALFSMLAFVSCSNDDDGSGSGGKGTGNPPKADFFPSHDDNYWIYDINKRVGAGNSETASDSLFVEVESDKTSKFILNINDGLHQANTVMNRFLTGSCEKTPTSLSVKGGFLSIGLFEGIDVPESVIFKLVDLDVKSGQPLSSYKKEVEQKIGEYPIKFSYEYKTTQLEILPEGAVINGDKYENTVAIASVSLKIDSNITIVVDKIGLTFPLLVDQETINIKSYYVDDIGLVRAETDIKLAFNEEIVNKIKEELDIDILDIGDIDLSYSSSEVQELSRYNVVLGK